MFGRLLTSLNLSTILLRPLINVLLCSPRAAFRARHMAAKSRASTSASAMAEILGIADSGSVTPSSLLSTPYPSTPFEPGPSTSSSEPSGAATPADELKLQELTVSSKSVMDYFKEKLAAKSRPSSSPGTPPVEEASDYDDRPRMGLGASKLRAEITQEVKVESEERRGLGGIGSGMRSSFASMFASATVTRSVESVADPEADASEQAEESTVDRKDKKDKSKKKDKKSKRDKGKEKAPDDAEELVDAPGTDEKAERKRRKEEKRRRKEAEAAAAAEAVSESEKVPSPEERERKRSKGKKSKTDR